MPQKQIARDQVKRNSSEEEAQSMTVAEQQLTEATQTFQTIEVSVEDRPKLWRLIGEKAWSGRYLGKNRFILTEGQIFEARRAGLTFRTV